MAFVKSLRLPGVLWKKQNETAGKERATMVFEVRPMYVSDEMFRSGSATFLVLDAS